MQCMLDLSAARSRHIDRSSAALVRCQGIGSFLDWVLFTAPNPISQRQRGVVKVGLYSTVQQYHHWPVACRKEACSHLCFSWSTVLTSMSYRSLVHVVLKCTLRWCWLTLSCTSMLTLQKWTIRCSNKCMFWKKNSQRMCANRLKLNKKKTQFMARYSCSFHQRCH